MISHPLFWLYVFFQFHIFVYLTNRLGIRPHYKVNELLWTAFFLTIQISPTIALGDLWNFDPATFSGLPLHWKLFLGLVAAWVLWLWLDHAWWLLARKKPVDYKLVREYFPNRPPRWPVPFSFLKYAGFPNQVYDFKVVEYEVKVPGWPKEFSGLSMVQLTDFHFGTHIHKEYMRMVVAEAKKLKPDFYALTGDFVSLNQFIPAMEGLLKGFKAPMGVYALLGNHDHWAGAKMMRRALEKNGIRVLQNEVVYLKRKGKKLALMGVDDKWVGEKNDRPILRAKADLKILLAHQPDHLYLAHKTGAPLQISGHCHGGQICFPVIGPLVVPSNDGRKYAGGFHREKNTVIYINRGIGSSPHLRTYCPPEVVKLVIKTP